MKALRAACMVVAAMAATGLGAPAWAAGPAGAVQALLLVQGAPAMSADEAAALVRTASGGRILGVRRVDGAGGPAYAVKVLLPGGRVRVYVVDAGSGQIIP